MIPDQIGLPETIGHPLPLIPTRTAIPVQIDRLAHIVITTANNRNFFTAIFLICKSLAARIGFYDYGLKLKQNISPDIKSKLACLRPWGFLFSGMFVR